MTDDEIIGPTPERIKKDPMSLSATDAHKDVTWRLDFECELDRLKENGLLEPHTQRRYTAGMWLRQLHINLYASQGIGAYSRDSIADTGEMSDQQAWNFRCYLDVQKAMSRKWNVLYTVCCDDKRYPHLMVVKDALDELALQRGID